MMRRTVAARRPGSSALRTDNACLHSRWVARRQRPSFRRYDSAARRCTVAANDLLGVLLGFLLALLHLCRAPALRLGRELRPPPSEQPAGVRLGGQSAATKLALRCCSLTRTSISASRHRHVQLLAADARESSDTDFSASRLFAPLGSSLLRSSSALDLGIFHAGATSPAPPPRAIEGFHLALEHGSGPSETLGRSPPARLSQRSRFHLGVGTRA